MEHLTEVLILIMLTVVYLQSGFDKVFDWKGNLEFMSGHFAKSPLKNSVPLLLGVVTFTEIAAGITSGIGCVILFLNGAALFAWIGAVLSILNFLFLLTGQRLAKDYAGAQTIVIYLVPSFFLLYLLSINAPLNL